tara:strand:+ start:20 stop:253 length:234 start_codon:yes stop_codon:yes gene_type:complete
MSEDKPIQEDKRMYDNHKEHGEDMSYENEQSMVTIPLKEYDKLKDQSKYITDDSLISAIDKIEFFVKELRKHIVRKF